MRTKIIRVKFNAILLMSCFLIFVFNISKAQINTKKKEWEIFPILNYDTDIGFGYGAKGFLYNFLNLNESFDLTIYNSTKGERWYNFIFSYPDIQRRQGKKYNLAFDLSIDYDKYINYKFYTDSYNDYSNFLFPQNKFDSLGNIRFKDQVEEYVREPIEIKAILSSALKKDFIIEFGSGLRSISCYGFDKLGILQYYNIQKTEQLSLLLNFRFDTRTNFINPQNGIVLQLSNEYSFELKNDEGNFYKLDLLLQFYNQPFNTNLISATRIKFQKLFYHDKLFYQNEIPIGGNNTIRGLPQSRYLSNLATIINEEIRFPIIGRFGGIAGVDFGNTPAKNFWIINPVVGLRFYMNNFVVRFDVGFDKNNTGIYFNFGHIF